MKTGHNILIIEPSIIVKEGLNKILHDTFNDLNILNKTSVNGVEELNNKKDYSLIMINPVATMGCMNHIISQLQYFPNARTIGLVSTSYNRELASIFDDLIYLNDNMENITKTLKNNLLVPRGQQTMNKQLSNRELDVLKLLVKGYSNKQIASELYISVHTVVTHRKNITRKLGISTTAGLTIYGVINNIIDIDDYLQNIQS